jgi:ssDNA-binding replication factor A large subunit
VFIKAYPDVCPDASYNMAQTKNVAEQDRELIWTDIVSLKNDSRNVNVRFMIIKKGAIRRVTSKSSGKQYEVVDCIVADATARINLTLWNEDIDLAEQGDWYCILNGFINIHDECMALSMGRRGEIERIKPETNQIKEDIDMSRPFMGRSRRRETRPKTGRTLNGTTGQEVRRYASRKSF